MFTTYVASDNTAGDAQTLADAVGKDIKVYQIIFGAPTAGKITHFYNTRVVGGHASGIGSVDTTHLKFKFTQPTAAAGNNLTYSLEFPKGMQLDGGSFHTDDDQVTVLWDYADVDK